MSRFLSLFFSGALLLAVHSGFAGELVLPGASLERSGVVTAIYRTIGQATGKADLQIKWTDAYGRIVEARTLPVELKDETEIRFPLDLSRAVSMQNHLQINLSFDGLNKKGEKDHREEDAETDFIARPTDRSWRDYMIIEWQDGSADHFRRLEDLGVNAGKSTESSMSIPASLLKANLRWYVENIATDFYSEYHRYRRDRPYNWSLLQAKDRYKKDPASKEALKRYPSLSDPVWLRTIHDRLVQAARTYSSYRPLFYNLADEAGIAELAGFWDFDFSDHSLAAMRTWLKERYGSLAALNRQWSTSFAGWDAVTPETTREAMKRSDENYSAWADGKEWMDVAFADALRMGVDAVHSVDGQAHVGIEGAQMPGWGGYDYARLSSTLDVMEPYDIGDNIEIIRSLNPRLIFVTTSFGTGPWEKHRVWYELLHGSRGHIIWDEKNDLILPDGSVGPRGRDVAPYWRELRSGVGALLINSVRQAGPIAIHYSQASLRMQWMRAQRPNGDAWLERMSWTERKDNDFLRLRDSYCRLIEDAGLQYNFVAYDGIERGELLKRGYRLLILPQSSALSNSEARAITAFVHQGGTLVVDGDVGIFDDHGRRLPASSLRALLDGDRGRGSVVRMNALDYADRRVLGTEAGLRDEMRKLAHDLGVVSEFPVADATGKPVTGVELHRFRNGGVTLVGLSNNPPIEVDELGPLKAKAQGRFEHVQAIRFGAPEDLYAYDVRRAKALGKIKQLALTIDPYEPTLLALSPTRFPALRISLPAKIARGETGHLAVSLDGPTAASFHVFHVEVTDPAHRTVRYFSGNLLADEGATEQLIPVAQNDEPGAWNVRVRDLLSGQEQQASFVVF